MKRKTKLILSSIVMTALTYYYGASAMFAGSYGA